MKRKPVLVPESLSDVCSGALPCKDLTEVWLRNPDLVGYTFQGEMLPPKKPPERVPPPRFFAGRTLTPACHR